VYTRLESDGTLGRDRKAGVGTEGQDLPAISAADYLSEGAEHIYVEVDIPQKEGDGM